MKLERILVISAHALDFLWRCGGTIAKYAERGNTVQVIDLTCGERGESNEQWKTTTDVTEAAVAVIRREEAETAAQILGVGIHFMGWPDHLLEATQKRIMELALEIRRFQPTILLTHFTADPFNPDHPTTADMVIKAVRCAQSRGVMPGERVCAAPKIFFFEPAYPEEVGYRPDTFINITETMQKKMEAMKSCDVQLSLANAYNKRNGYRGHIASKLSGDSSIAYAETFVRFKPYVGNVFC